MKNALDLAARRKDDWICDLFDCLRIPSISTKPDYADRVAECAQWIVAHLQAMGIENVHAAKTAGHPVVTGDHIVDPSRPTVLVYGHYDVQPPEPLELWTSPPFEPEIRDGDIYARGAVDDKGQLFMILKAIQAYMESEDDLPVNLKFAIEGEEEASSDNLEPFLLEHKDKLVADTVLVCDTTMIDPQTPAITAGLRGMSYMQINLRGGTSDLHSGAFGGTVVNTLHVLGEIIARLHDSDNRVAVPGFYDDVLEPTDEMRDQVAQIPFDMDRWRESSGNSVACTEKGYSIVEATTVRPCLDVNGVWGGYQGDGAKTVIACEAGCKLSARLVANQDGADIHRKVKAYVESLVPDGFEVDVQSLAHGSPVSVSTESPAIRAATEAIEGTFGRGPVMNRSGGSIPAVALFKEVLGIDGTLLGFALKSDGVHAPNEKFGLDRFEKGLETIIRFFHHFGATSS
jgi:acetylornithine deacetylase/succinyl-diaminopimelate desuccinylase-like protein